jgi:hypothetical protein
MLGPPSDAQRQAIDRTSSQAGEMEPHQAIAKFTQELTDSTVTAVGGLMPKDKKVLYNSAFEESDSDRLQMLQSQATRLAVDCSPAHLDVISRSLSLPLSHLPFFCTLQHCVAPLLCMRTRPLLPVQSFAAMDQLN